MTVLNHEQCTAILDCIENSINLEVYLGADGKATGFLYIDDGHSFKYQNDPDASAFIRFDFDGQDLSAIVNSDYKFADS